MLRSCVFYVAVGLAAPWVAECTGASAGAETAAHRNPLTTFTHDWRENPVWHDGKAEVAVYDATRIIYGRPRHYTARLYTNKEHASKQTKTKAADSTGRAVFKHHLREDIATENYTYHYSTMCYVGATDLKSLKIDMGSQEDCGASFKQFINHAGTLEWHQFSYFPKEGHRRGSYQPHDDLAYQDALSMILRGYPSEQPKQIELRIVPDQTSTRLTSPQPEPARVEFGGRQTTDVPIGRIETFRVHVITEGGIVHQYWFAAEGGSPWLHVMVQYEGPGGLRFKLREHKRSAYWKR